jgi:hypothetical protein
VLSAAQSTGPGSLQFAWVCLVLPSGDPCHNATHRALTGQLAPLAMGAFTSHTLSLPAGSLAALTAPGSAYAFSALVGSVDAVAPAYAMARVTLLDPALPPPQGQPPVSQSAPVFAVRLRSSLAGRAVHPHSVLWLSSVAEPLPRTQLAALGATYAWSVSPVVAVPATSTFIAPCGLCSRPACSSVCLTMQPRTGC